MTNIADAPTRARASQDGGIRPAGWVPLVALPGAVLLLGWHWTPWLLMWVLAGAIFWGCKWLTWWLAAQSPGKISPARSVGYLLLWPGMDADRFLANPREGAPPRPKAEWVQASLKTIAGATFLWLAMAGLDQWPPLAAGWLGMAGLVLLLHFGLFHLLALAWQSAGLNAAPIMRSPLRATSLSDFWSARWNDAFNRLAHKLVYIPLVRRVGVAAAAVLAFAASGLIHELVISVPARAGWGLPTLYFLIQGVGLLVERSQAGRAVGLGRGVRGKAFTFLVTAGPVFWLFHPPFVTTVVVPFLEAMQ